MKLNKYIIFKKILKTFRDSKSYLTSLIDSHFFFFEILEEIKPYKKNITY